MSLLGIERPRLLRRSVLARLRAVPSVATTKVLARATGGLYFSGGLLVLVAALPAGHWSGASLPIVRSLAALSAVTGLVVARAGERLPGGAYHPLVVIGTALVTTQVLLGNGGDPSVALAVPYIFVVLDASFFCGGIGLACHLLLVLVASGAAMGYVGLPWPDILMTQGFFVVVAAMVAWLARVADLAEQDPLTGLVNRRGFDRRIERELAGMQRERGHLALVLLDLDNFKIVNDTAGHLGGDQLLRSCARAWRRILADGQTLSRHGGDEFAVLLPGCSLGKAADIADRLRAAAPEEISVSAGVSAWNPGDTASVLLGRADVALYEAKSAGRAQTVVYGDPARGASELEAAIVAGELLLHYQPVIRLSDATMVAAEALVRWNHPRRGLVPPLEFVPQAERTGAIHALGRWTLERACVLTAAPHVTRGVGVNVSVAELRNPDYADLVGRVLAASGLEPGRLTIEVTEALFDDHDPQVVRTLESLRALGVTVAIDDFGAGYSSLRWLERFPADYVKIDRSFVAAIDPERDQQPVLSAIIAVCHSLGITVVAEGVETPEQAAVLRELGCDLAQGYLLGRPVPPEQLAEGLAEGLPHGDATSAS